MIQLEDVGAIITMSTKSDPNGNPRRISVLFDRDGQLIAGAEHGYAGEWHAITTALGRDVDVWSDRLPWPIAINVGISEWRTWRARVVERMAERARIAAAAAEDAERRAFIDELTERYGVPAMARIAAADVDGMAAGQ